MNEVGISSVSSPLGDARIVDDVCTVALTRRLAAMLDRDPWSIEPGHSLPRGWHLSMFNLPTRQSALRPDGAGDLGIVIPDLGLSQLLMAGRTIAFVGDIPIGANVRRSTRRLSLDHKQGRSGPFSLLSVEHRLTVADEGSPAVIETTRYVLRNGDAGKDRRSTLTPAPDTAGPILASREIHPDEALLFRYSAITDNPHRIHYDYRFATEVEGHPSLVVNGSLPLMFLLELFREYAAREPVALDIRNIAPMYCGQPLSLTIVAADEGFVLRAGDERGILFEARAQ